MNICLGGGGIDNKFIIVVPSALGPPYMFIEEEYKESGTNTNKYLVKSN